MRTQRWAIVKREMNKKKGLQHISASIKAFKRRYNISPFAFPSFIFFVGKKGWVFAQCMRPCWSNQPASSLFLTLLFLHGHKRIKCEEDKIAIEKSYSDDLRFVASASFFQGRNYEMNKEYDREKFYFHFLSAAASILIWLRRTRFFLSSLYCSAFVLLFKFKNKKII